nr:histidine kinase [uncultured Blautia sp.]
MEKRRRSQLYFKLFWTYTAIALVIVSVLTIYFMYLSKRSVLRQNQEEREHISANAAEYIRETEERVDYLYQDLCRSSSELEDLLSYFTLDPEEYQQWSLDRYSASSALVYKGIYNFITEAFEAYQELEKVELIGYNDLRMTECYPDKIFYPGKSGKGKINAFRDGTYGEEGKLVYVREIRNPNTMAQEGCMVFTFEGKAVFEKIRRNSEYTGLFVNFQGQQPVFEENLQADTKYDSVKKETVGEYEVCTLLNQKAASRLSVSAFFTILGVGVLVMILGILLIAHDVGRFTARVDTILDTMNQVATGDLQARVDIRNRKDELDMLADHFNNMCEKLNLYINKSYLAEIEKKNAQMQALQSQINPHFLYNTLEAIRMKAICNGDREVGKMLYSMVTLFRSQLKETDIITLGQELDYCKQYLELFEYRYKGIFRSEVSCEPELLSVPIIKFVLQPVVENYFIHGIDRGREDNCVRIWAERNQGSLTLFVRDNGCGMTEAEIAEKNRLLRENPKDKDKKTSIGLSNVNRRIKAVYGEEYGISIEAAKPQGLLVKVTIKIEDKIEEMEVHEESHACGR